MRAYVVLQRLSLFIALLSLTAAFILVGYWFIVVLLVAMVAFWFGLRKHSTEWRSACLLSSYTGAAAVGVVLGVEAALMLLGMTAALAAWDLINFGQTLRAAGSPVQLNLLWRVHLRSLVLALGLGTVLSMTSIAVDLTVPFPLAAVLALTLVVSLVRGTQHVSGRET